jgi:uncharacterized protein YeaO (DUF488 family)
MPIAVKRVYSKPAKTDGTRVLVDRLWPRGLSKESAAIRHWFRNLAPSDELRQWFHAHRESWSVFRHRYMKELRAPDAAQALEQLHQLAEAGKVTLLYASKDEVHNNAVALKQLLEGARKPPTGTGPAAAGAMRTRRAMRAPMR